METSSQQRAATFLDRGREQRKQGARAEALAAFEAAAEATPDNDGIQVEIACELRALDRVDDARQVLDGILVRAPHFTNALIELGHLSRRQNNQRGALAAFEGAAANHPEHVGLQLEIVRSLRALDRLDEAEARLVKVLATHPGDLAALIERGHLSRRQGDLAGALAAFEVAAAIDKSHAGIRLEIAETLRALGRTGEAEKALRRVLKSNPADASALIRLTRLLADAGRADEAGALFDKVAATLAGNRGVASAAVYVARRSERSEAALRFLDQAVAADGGNLDLALDLAAERRRRGDIDAARKLAERVLATIPGHVGAWMEIGYQRRAANDREGAMAAFAAAARREPPPVQALVEVANEAWAAGNPGEARAFLDRALAQDGKHLATLLTCAEHALRSDHPEEALGYAERAIAAHPGQLDPRLVAARAAAAIPDRQRALAHLEEARTLGGDRPDVLASRIHVLRALGEPGAAITLAAAAGEAASHQAAWAEVAATRILAGDFRGAKALLDALPERRADMARVHFFRGQLAEAGRDYPGAVSEYAIALRGDPANGDGHGEMARACLLSFDLDTARDHLRLSMRHNTARTVSRGQSQNPSQTHVGQLLDEFALDVDMISRLRELARLAPAKRLAKLKPLVTGRPESTAAAISLVLASRSATPFRGARRSAIPRVVVQFWDSAEPPPDVRELMASWDDGEGGWEHRVFDDRAAEAFLREHFAPPVRQAFGRARHPAQRADLFRLAYLAHAGGVYADADDRRIASLANLVPAGAKLVSYLENYGTLGNNFLAAEPGHPAIQHALDLAVAAINRGDHDVIWLSTGPGLVTRAVAQYLAGASAKDAAAIVLRELHEMRPLVDLHCPTRYKATTQHWSRAEFARSRMPGPMADSGKSPRSEVA